MYIYIYIYIHITKQYKASKITITALSSSRAALTLLGQGL